jgi:hypothetical protein
MSLIGKRILSYCVRDFLFRGRYRPMVNKELLDILACPKCKEKVVLSDAGTHLVCARCRVRYPIEEDIPIMLIDRAENID